MLGATTGFAPSDSGAGAGSEEDTARAHPKEKKTRNTAEILRNIIKPSLSFRKAITLHGKLRKGLSHIKRSVYKPGSVRWITTVTVISLETRSLVPSSSLPAASLSRWVLSPLTWPCSSWGLPCRSCCHDRGGLLPRLFTLTSREAVCFLWHFPSPRLLAMPRRYLAAFPTEPGLSSN